MNGGHFDVALELFDTAGKTPRVSQGEKSHHKDNSGNTGILQLSLVLWWPTKSSHFQRHVHATQVFSLRYFPREFSLFFLSQNWFSVMVLLTSSPPRIPPTSIPDLHTNIFFNNKNSLIEGLFVKLCLSYPFTGNTKIIESGWPSLRWSQARRTCS